MKKTGQLAKKSKLNVTQSKKKDTPAKVPNLKAKQLLTSMGKKSVAAKLLVPAKSGSDSDEEQDSDDDSEQNAPEESEESNGLDNSDKSNGLDNGDTEEDDDEEVEEEEEEDSESAEDGEDKSDNQVVFGAKSNLEEESDEEADEESREEDSSDEAPEEKPLKKESKAPASKNEAQASENERKVFVRRLNKDTSDDMIKKHFATCGEIEVIRLSKHKHRPEAMVIFTDAAASHAALKMHNTIMNDGTILVHHAAIHRPKSDPECTIVLKNADGLRKLEGAKLEKILSKCGAIESMSLVCEKNILAFVSFQNAESVKKAMQLEGTTQDGIKIEIGSYTNKPPRTKVFVRNIAQGTTSDELREMFEVCGPIHNIVLRQNNPLPSTAVITFKNQESYCQSFLLHEEKLRGNFLLLQPFSENPKFKVPKQNFQKRPFNKRPQPGMWKSGPPAKRNK